MGHNSQGLCPVESKIKAIKEAPISTNATQLKAYLGLLNFYSKYLKNLSLLKPLYRLLEYTREFIWNEECDKAFNASKNLLTKQNMLAHFDPKKPIIVTTDASSYGLGDVLSHKVGNKETPIMFASCTLSKSEQNYAQVHKEALGIIFAVRKFHKFIFGRKFTLVTDYQSLQTTFGNKQSIPTLAHSRIQRWAIILSAYDYEIKYKRATQVACTDGLSRLPLPDPSEDEQVLRFADTNELPITHREIAEETK